MKVLVSVKRVIDYNTSIRIKPDGTGIETAHVKMSMNPFDSIAMEEAIRLKEQGVAKQIIAISIGGNSNQETLRTALAMGADQAILVLTDTDLQPLAIAKILRAITIQESPNLIFLGKQSIDNDNNQTGQMLAGLLNWAQGTYVSNLTVLSNNTVTVVREIDGGLETVCLNLPAVITTDLRLNEPRHLSLPNIMKAKQKSITILSVEKLNIDIQPRLQIMQVIAPTKKRAGVKVTSAAELVKNLSKDAGIIE